MSIKRYLDYKKEYVHRISKMVENLFKDGIVSMLECSNHCVLETLVYIVGCSLHAMKKSTLSRRAMIAIIMNYPVYFCSIAQNDAQGMGLPTGKIDQVMTFFGLMYPLEKYFEFLYRYDCHLFCFVVFILLIFILFHRIENSFRTLLSMESLVI